MKKAIFICILALTTTMTAQLDRVEPPNWWIGFKDTSLQILVKGKDISKATPHIDYEGVSIKTISKGSSPNYLFIDLNIDKNTLPGNFSIEFRFDRKKSISYTYSLKARKSTSDSFLGFDSSDVIYLITPDRFANGNPVNDIHKNLKEKAIDRQDDYGRHGGDIQGIKDHLDYISEMGFTAIWPTPMLTNDMPKSSYHGYAITDFYEVDPRFGTLREYIELSQNARAKGIKLIMDMVANHCGGEHWWMKDLPFDDWLNDQKNYVENSDNWNWEVAKYSNHRRTTNQDMYASSIDKKGMHTGWFVHAMPDLNQKNPFLANYIIQNSIWWIETLELGGIRQDTYPYPDKDFMARWAGAIMKEYPNFNIVGEEWSYNPLLVGYWQQGAKNKDGYQSNLKSTMDFPLQKAIVDALNEEESWDKGLVKIYEGLANDFYYPNPSSIMIFPDNHDMDRIFTQLHKDVVNTKMALGYLLTLPRIAQVYYGTEILKENSEKRGDHGLIRSDFPGGWVGDTVNAFTGEGLTKDQQEMQSFIKKLLNYRKYSKAIHKGKTIHFAPENGVYLLSRTYKDETVLVILNKNSDEVNLSLNRFDELALLDRNLKNLVTGEVLVWKESITLGQKGITLLTTKFD